MSTPWINKVILPLPYLTLTLHDLYKKSVNGLNKEQSAEVAKGHWTSERNEAQDKTHQTSP